MMREKKKIQHGKKGKRGKGTILSFSFCTREPATDLTTSSLRIDVSERANRFTVHADSYGDDDDDDGSGDHSP